MDFMDGMDLRGLGRVLLVVGAVSLCASPARAQVVYVDAAATGSGNGTSWADAAHAVQTGIDLAAGSGAAEVWVAAGVYPESVTMKNGIALYGGFTGVETQRDQRSPTANVTVIDASGTASGFHALVFDSVSNAILDGFIITGGQANGTGPDGVGGGVVCRNLGAGNEIANCRITGNSASEGGGGLYCLHSSPSLRNTTLTQNTSASNGAGVYCLTLSSPSFDGCVLNNNQATSQGGAVYCFNQCAPSFANTTLFVNTAGENGGAMSCVLNSSPAVTNCVIYDNSALTGHGGGVYCQLNSDPLFTNTIFVRNTDYAIYEADGDSDPSAFYCLFNNNSAGHWFDYETGPQNNVNDINLYVVGAAFNVRGVPRFAAPGGGDFHLRDSSNALKRGTSDGAPAFDIDGDPRPGADGKVDIGIDEADAFNPPPDASPPVSEVFGLRSLTATAVFNVSFRASDAESGVAFVNLWFRKDGAAWTQYGADFTASPIAFDSALTGGDGFYEFKSLATDNTGNPETDTGADAQTRVLTHFASARVYVSSGGTGAGQSWGDPLGVIQDAIEVAAAFGRREVWVSQGLYSENLYMRSGVKVFGGFNGTEVFLYQRDLSANQTTISPLAAYHVVVIASVTSTTLDGFTITGGNAGGGGADDDGGGIYCSEAGDSNVIANCHVTGNSASGYGGGVYCFRLSSPLIVNCRIDGNQCGEGQGGGLACATFSEPAISACAINDNIGEFGGGLFVEFGSPRIVNCEIARNSAFRGGAFYGHFYCDSPVLECTVDGNSSSDLGGAFYFYGCYHPAVTNTIISNTTGIAIYEADAYSDPATSHCLFFNNPDGHYFDHGPFPGNGGIIFHSVAILDAAVPEAKGSIEGDPFFVNSAGGDYHLQSTSPAIDAGTGVAVSVDRDGTPRPIDIPGMPPDGTGNEFDIGEYEFSGLSVIVGQRLVFAPQRANQGPGPAQTVTVRNNSSGAITFTLIGIFGANADEFSFDQAPDASPLAPGASRDFFFHFDPVSQGPKTATFQLFGIGGSIQVQLFGEGVVQIARVQPVALDFGRVACDIPPLPVMTTQTVTISNPGNLDLGFTGAGLQVGGPDALQFGFDVHPSTDTAIAPGEARPVRVGFRPAPPLGPKSAWLLVTTDDPAHSVTTVTLTGAVATSATLSGSAVARWMRY